MTRAHWPITSRSEAQAEREILWYLQLRGILAWPTHGPRNRPVVPGMPDIVGVLSDGSMIAIEVKSEGGKLSKQQEQFHEQLLDHNVRVIVARSIDDIIQAGL